MSNTGRFLLAGVMGWPVMHSRSPLLHNYWFGKHGLAGTYVPLAIRPEGLEAALRALHPLGFAGVNLTIPHKERALAIVDEVDDVARAIGAASCVTVRADGTLAATNNDCYGFIDNLRREAPPWRPDAGPVAVIGAGGGSRAVCYGLLREGVKELRLVNRTRSRAEAVAADLGGPIRVHSWEERNDVLEGVALAVNTTSCGMTGQPPLDVDLAKLPAHALVADIVYIPLETPFLRAARERGHRTVNGLGMLLSQGRPAWKAWFGIEPEVTPELRQMIENTIPR